jgi:FixJ family two-component response regulator
VAGQIPHIAIVDDEESIRRALGRLIRSAGFAAETFASGDEFLETISDHEPDCIVLDLHMPKVDGFRVQAWLSRAGYRIPIIVITGRDTPKTSTLVMSSGAFAYFRKPVDGDALLNAIAVATKKNGDSTPQQKET